MLEIIAVFLWSMVILTFTCAFIYPRTIFGNMLLLGAAFFIAENFAFEETPRPMVPVFIAIPFVIGYLFLAVRSAHCLAKNADARLWSSAGMQGIYRYWQSYTVSGRRANRYWLMRVVCSLGLLIALMSGFGVRAFKPRLAEISHLEYVISDLDEVNPKWASWPNTDVKAAAGAAGWGAWRPQAGARGRIVWWMDPNNDSKHRARIYVLEIGDQTGIHYVPVTGLGMREVTKFD